MGEPATEVAQVLAQACRECLTKFAASAVISKELVAAGTLYRGGERQRSGELLLDRDLESVGQFL